MGTFNEFLNNNGLTQEAMDEVAKTLPTPLDVMDDRKHTLKTSSIQGLGIHSGKDYKFGENVCTLRIGKLWTICGRYINHSDKPNLMPMLRGSYLYGLAKKTINKKEELTVDYQDMYDLIQGAKSG